MTYCLSLLCRDWIVCVSDSRTSAGVDNITVQSKMRVFAEEGQRVLCLMTSGNLSLSQTVLSFIEEDLLRGKVEPDVAHLMNRATMFEAARYVGQKVRQVADLDRAALESNGFSFNVNLLLAGQIRGLPPQAFLIYPQGNSLHSTVSAPFLQIGEFKYGKPILDRGFTYHTRLTEAVKLAILSMEATMKSNVSVGPPLDVLALETDSLTVRHRARMEENDDYLRDIRQQWSAGLVKLVGEMPGMKFPEVPFQPGATTT
jgi:putative proteasome-type protease